MPKYTHDIKDLIWEEDAKAMYDICQNKREALLLSLCWLTGARPSELLLLTTDNFQIDDTHVVIYIKTLKLGAGKEYFSEQRTLKLSRQIGVNANIYLETVVRYILETPPGAKLLDYTSRWAEKVIERLSCGALHKRLTPYHFRHSVLTWLARHGATLDQLKHFKGAKTAASVEPYLSAVPYIIKMENLKRGHSTGKLGLGEQPTMGKASP